MLENAKLDVVGQLGYCGDRQVFLGFASASELSRVSFADTLDESTGAGYQRRFNRGHSLEFKKYIQQSGASTIPLTFNLRPELAHHWKIVPHPDTPGTARLFIAAEAGNKVMAQVDCQHRLGYLKDSEIPFAFMAYIGLTVSEEMTIFRDINGKAKGLSSSLLDYTEARLLDKQLAHVNPALSIALQLNNDGRSPWYQKLDLGGNVTVGMKRVASLRTMQQAVRRFLKEAQLPETCPTETVARILMDFWNAVVFVLPEVWANAKAHMLVKGVGVYCLMSMAGELTKEANIYQDAPELDYFIGKLSDFLGQVDWSNKGPLQGYGGVKGADVAFNMLRIIRSNSVTPRQHGKQKHLID